MRSASRTLACSGGYATRTRVGLQADLGFSPQGDDRGLLSAIPWAGAPTVWLAAPAPDGGGRRHRAAGRELRVRRRADLAPGPGAAASGRRAGAAGDLPAR